MTSTGTDLAIGLLLGMVGGAIQLAITWWRASMAAARGSAAPALLTYPLSFLGPAAAILIAAKVAPAAAWITVVGLFGARFLGLRAASSAQDRGSGTAEGAGTGSQP